MTYITKKHYIIGDVMSKINPNDWESFDDMLNKKRDKKKKKAKSLKIARDKKRKEKYEKKYN